jgi:hypothetical protein
MPHVAFNFMVDELEGFKDFNLALGMLLAIVNASNFGQIWPTLPQTTKICQNLPKDEILKYHQQLRF